MKRSLGRIRCQSLRHKTEFDSRLDALADEEIKRVEDKGAVGFPI